MDRFVVYDWMISKNYSSDLNVNKFHAIRRENEHIWCQMAMVYSMHWPDMTDQ